MDELQALMARAQVAQAKRLGYRDASTRYDPKGAEMVDTQVRNQNLETAAEIIDTLLRRLNEAADAVPPFSVDRVEILGIVERMRSDRRKIQDLIK